MLFVTCVTYNISLNTFHCTKILKGGHKTWKLKIQAKKEIHGILKKKITKKPTITCKLLFTAKIK